MCPKCGNHDLGYNWKTDEFYCICCDINFKYDVCDEREVDIQMDDGDIRYTITDENGQYVHADSIRMAFKKFYYIPYKRIEDGCITYSKLERAEKALHNLELHNQIGKLGHKFQIIREIK